MAFAKVEQVANALLPTRWGKFRILGFEGRVEGGDGVTVESAAVLAMGDLAAQQAESPQPHQGLTEPDRRFSPPLVRIHSQCLTGDVFHSLRCDCRMQLELALSMIAGEGAGLLIYEHQEGRGIGLMAKLRAYELQDRGLDTVEANLELGFRADHREFELPAAILNQLGIASVRLITNNPEKVRALEAAGIRVVERISAAVEPVESFERYLEVKRQKLGHIVDPA